MNQSTRTTIAIQLCLGIGLVSIAAAQEESPSPTPTPAPALYSPQTLSELKQLQQAALKSDYAYRQVAHLSNNIGPRLTGSAQAQKAVDYVAAELKALGLEVQLEKLMVPHWVRGEETAALVEFPGMAENTTQKIVLCALGSSVATPAEGLTAEVVVVRDFDELEALGKDKVVGKIVLFNYHFDKQMAAQSRAGDAYSQAVKYRSDGATAAGRLGAVASLIRSVGGAEFRLPPTGQNDYKKDAPKILAGGKTYANDHEKEIANHFAAMETDGGAGHPLGINYATKPEAKTFFEPIARILQSSGASILNLAEHPGADISPLTKLGVPGFSPIQDNRYYFNYHHTAADTLDKIVPQELAENAAVVTVTAYALANLEKPFPR